MHAIIDEQIAAAWADGQLTQTEINSVKEVLIRLPHSGGPGQPAADGT